MLVREVHAEAPELRAPLVQVRAHREDLEPDNPHNPYRVAPSSRPATQTFDADDIAALKPRDVYDLLGQAVGTLPMYQGRKVPWSIFIRGDSNFGFIVDGVYMTETTGSRVLANLPPMSIEQVDIVRDATALTLAPLVNFVNPSGAPNDGFIVIRTRRPRDTEATLRGTVESYETSSVGLFAGTTGGMGYGSVLASGYRSSGRPEDFTARSSDTLQGRLGLQVGGFTADLMLYNDRTGQQFQAADPRVSTLAPQRWQMDPADTTFGSLNLAMAWTPDQTTTFTAFRSDLSLTLLQGTTAPVPPNVITNLETIDGFDLKHTLRVGQTLVRGGGQYLDWNTPTGQSFYEGQARHERIAGYFLHGEQGLLDRRLILDAAYRIDEHYVVRGIDLFQMTPGLGGGQQLQVVNDRQLPSSRYGAVGASLHPLPGWTLTGRAFRGEQGALSAVATVGGKPLDPERQTKYEASIGWAALGAMAPTLTWFRSDIEHAKAPVQYVQQGTQRIALYDQSDILREGFELAVRGQWESAIGSTRYQFGWTYLSHTGGVLESGRTPPRNLGTFSLTHLWRDWDLNASARRVDQFYSNFQSIGNTYRPIGDYTRVDTSVGRSFRTGRGTTHLSLFVRNVGGVRYETQLGFPDPGRWIGVELVLDL